ncbi:hypothetical protein CEXT_94611 [Caerostris extrusa]|uniref:Uncharacterized protein n=1 Tax=Caerostris extrusa TaxID=172846 RepID=A0AAV4QNR1_CAEEX|nr:hypothetical protein CEXT_94611 [Caerostris extrusa]
MSVKNLLSLNLPSKCRAFALFIRAAVANEEKEGVWYKRLTALGAKHPHLEDPSCSRVERRWKIFRHVVKSPERHFRQERCQMGHRL